MEIVTKIAPIALAIIMLGLGLGLSVKDFTRVLTTPKDFLVGFISQLIILPLVALIIAIFLNLHGPERHARARAHGARNPPLYRHARPGLYDNDRLASAIQPEPSRCLKSPPPKKIPTAKD